MMTITPVGADYTTSNKFGAISNVTPINPSVQIDFDLQTLMNITGQNALLVKDMNQQLGVVATTVTSLCNDMSAIKGDIDQLKLNEEITTTQCEVVKETARKRISMILGSNPLDRAKYYRIFIGHLYTGAKKDAGLGSSISRTRKAHYQMVLDYIEAWNPYCGVSALKDKADVRAAARREAKEQGY